MFESRMCPANTQSSQRDIQQVCTLRLCVSAGNVLVKIAFALATRVIDVDDFQFSVKIQRGRTLLAIADTGALDAAKGNVRFAAGSRRVDVRHARFDLIDETKDTHGIVGK